MRRSLEIVLLHTINCEVVRGVGGRYRRHHDQQRDKEQKGQRKTAAKHFHHFANFVEPHDEIQVATISNPTQIIQQKYQNKHAVLLFLFLGHREVMSKKTLCHCTLLLHRKRHASGYSASRS